jgi:hypothetical protein
MTSASTTGQTYLILLNSNNLQNHPIVITSPIYCKLKRYSRVKPTSNQQIVSREFDIVANAYGLQYGILLFLSPLPQLQPRYGLTIKIRDALGFRLLALVCIEL